MSEVIWECIFCFILCLWAPSLLIYPSSVSNLSVSSSWCVLSGEVPSVRISHCCLSENIFPLLKDISTGYTVLGWQLFSSSSLKIPLHFIFTPTASVITCLCNQGSFHIICFFLATSQIASFIFGVQSFQYNNSRVDFFYPACDSLKLLNLRVCGSHEFKRRLHHHHHFSVAPPLFSLLPLSARLSVCDTFLIYVHVFNPFCCFHLLVTLYRIQCSFIRLTCLLPFPSSILSNSGRHICCFFKVDFYTLPFSCFQVIHFSLKTY